MVDQETLIRRVVIVGCALFATALYLSAAITSEPVPVRRAFSEFPVHIGLWESRQNIDLDRQTLSILGVDDYLNRVYSQAGSSLVGLYIGYYRSQGQGHTMHSPLNCLPGSGWMPTQKDIRTVPLAAWSSPSVSPSTTSGIRINRLVVQKGGERQVVLYWYQSNGRIIASEYSAKIYAVYDAIRTNHTNGTLVRIVSPVAAGGEPALSIADEAAMEFSRSVIPLLKEFLPEIQVAKSR